MGAGAAAATATDTSQTASTDATTTDTSTATDTDAATDETSSDTTDWKAKSREWEKRAKANADAAKRLEAIEESQKTEAQKAADRLAAAESERDAARIEALRYRIAAKHNISDEDAELYLHGTDEEAIERQAKGIAAKNQAAGSIPKPDRSQGDQGSGGKGGSDMNALIRGTRRGA